MTGHKKRTLIPLSSFL